MATIEIKLIPIKSTRTWWFDERGLSFSLYKYTVLHTDLVPMGSNRYEYKCNICDKKELYSVTQAIFHIRNCHLYKGGKGVTNKEITDKHFESMSIPNMKKRESELNVDLGTYKLVIASSNRLTELIISDVDVIEEIMKCNRIDQVEDLICSSKEGLISTMEDFEKNSQEICDRYLGTPKEISPIQINLTEVK